MPAIKPPTPRLNRSHPRAYGLALALPFYEGSGGSVNDISGNGYNGTLTTTGSVKPVWSGGQSGWCLKFDGASSYITGPPSSALFPTTTTAATITCWFNATSVTSDQRLFTVSNATTSLFAMLVGRTSGKASGFARDSGGALVQIDSSASVSAGVWNHVAVTISGTTATLYLNGAVAGSATVSASQTFNTVTTATTISGSSAQVGIFGGLIDDVKAWRNRALTLADIEGEYADSFAMYRSRRFAFKAASGILFDATSNSGYQAASSSLSWSHTWSGTNRFLAVNVELLSVTDTVTAMTYGGATCTLVGAQSVAGGTGRVEQWRITGSDSGAPAAGANTISVTLSGSLACAGTAISYTGAHQTLPTESWAGASGINVGAANASVAVTPVADKTVVIAACATNDPAAAANQTGRNDVTGAAGSGIDEDSGPTTISPPSTQTMTVAVAALKMWAIGGYAIRPVAASGPSGGFNAAWAVQASRVIIGGAF